MHAQSRPRRPAFFSLVGSGALARWWRAAGALGSWAAVLALTGGPGLPRAAAEEARVVRIGYQKSGAFLLLRAEGELEKRLAPLGYRVEWREFPSGPPILEALNAHSVDLGHSGDAPVVFAQARGIPFVYLGTTPPSPQGAGVLVPPGSTVQQVADLKGKKIAFARGSSSHYFMVRALETAGLTLADVHPVYLQPPDARAAFESGTVDAWAVWDPFLAAGEVDAHGRTLPEGRDLTSHREFYFARPDFVAQHRAAVAAVVAALQESGARAARDPAATAGFLGPRLGLAKEVAVRWEQRKHTYGVIPVTPEIVAEQQQVADTFHRLNLIPRPVRVADLVPPPSDLTLAAPAR